MKFFALIALAAASSPAAYDGTTDLDGSVVIADAQTPCASAKIGDTCETNSVKTNKCCNFLDAADGKQSTTSGADKLTCLATADESAYFSDCKAADDSKAAGAYTLAAGAAAAAVAAALF